MTDKTFVEALRCWHEVPDGGTPEDAIRLLAPLCDAETQLRLTPKTVEQHILHLKRKLGAKNVAQAVAKGMIATLLPAAS